MDATADFLVTGVPTLLAHGHMLRPGGVPVEAVVVVFPPGREPYLPLFTDDDLAARAIGGYGEAGRGLVSVRPADFAALADLLGEAERCGVTHVAHDPGEWVSAVPIADVVAAIRRDCCQGRRVDE